jgi:putative ABC transport system substrate-binding protein
MAGVALMPCVHAQRGSKGMRVGWLGWTGAVGTSASAPALAAFRGGLADRGWTEGRDLELVVRDGDRPRSAELASELLRLDISLLVAQGPMAFGAKTVTGTKPLVFSINGDPVEAGLVASLSRPGGNATGVTALSAELAGKRLELLKEAMRKGMRVAVVANEVHPGVALEREAAHAAARHLGLTVAWYPLKASSDLDAAFAAIARNGADALLAIPDNLINREARPIADFAAAHRLPSISGWSEFVEAGNLMSYGPNPGGYYRQMAFITDRILRGAQPADLAVEQPRDIEFVVNVKVARAIGLALPPGLLLRADRQIL